MVAFALRAVLHGHVLLEASAASVLEDATDLVATGRGIEGKAHRLTLRVLVLPGVGGVGRLLVLGLRPLLPLRGSPGGAFALALAVLLDLRLLEERLRGPVMRARLLLKRTATSRVHRQRSAKVALLRHRAFPGLSESIAEGSAPPHEVRGFLSDRELVRDE
jgi:hypothetical protein